ncbi:MAG: tetratricopeptide repeat protein [Caldilineaceae bacterium]
MTSENLPGATPLGEARNPELTQALFESGRLLSQNRPGEAVERLLPFAQKDPTDPDLAINLGGAYILQRKWERAARILRQAVEAHPENAMLWTNLGAAELGVLETAGPKQQERAIAAYERALEADAAAPNVHYHLALIYKHRGELNRAAAFFQRALEVNPADRDARNWLDRLDAFAAEDQALRRRSAPPGAENASSN